MTDDRRNWTTRPDGSSVVVKTAAMSDTRTIRPEKLSRLRPPPVEGSATVFGMYGTRMPLLVS